MENVCFSFINKKRFLFIFSWVQMFTPITHDLRQILKTNVQIVAVSLKTGNTERWPYFSVTTGAFTIPDIFGKLTRSHLTPYVSAHSSFHSVHTPVLLQWHKAGIKTSPKTHRSKIIKILLVSLVQLLLCSAPETPCKMFFVIK